MRPGRCYTAGALNAGPFDSPAKPFTTYRREVGAFRRLPTIEQNMVVDDGDRLG
jgi:hypothetical protein